MKPFSKVFLAGLLATVFLGSSQAEALLVKPTRKDSIVRAPLTLNKPATRQLPARGHANPLRASTAVPIPEEKKGKSKLSILQGMNFLFVLSSALVALAPPPALVSQLGAQKATALLSMVSGAGALTEISLSPVVGSALDRNGRKPALVLTVLALALSNAVVAVRSTSVAAICAAKFAGMLSLGFFTLTTQAMISDISMSTVGEGQDTEKMVSSAMGMQMALTGVAFLMGVIGAGQLSEKGGLGVIFGASAGIGALTAFLLSTFMPETLTRSKHRRSEAVASGAATGWKALLKAPLASARLLYRHGKEVRVLAVLLMLMSIPANQGDFLQIYSKSEWGLSTKGFSSYLALFGLVSIFANGLGSVLVKKMGVKKFTSLAIVSRALTAIGTAFFGYKGSVIGLIVGFLGAAQSIGVVAALMSAGTKSGLPQGELAGERSSLLALLKVVGPLWYSMLYIQGASRLKMNNLPFLFNIGLSGVAFVIAQVGLKDEKE